MQPSVLQNFLLISCLFVSVTASAHQNIRKISYAQIAYAREWLQQPYVCTIKRNRLKGESLQKCGKRVRARFQKSLKYIEIAAAEFKLSPDHLTCLLLQESQFAANASSGTGPLGMAQYSKGTLATKKVTFSSTVPPICSKIKMANCSDIRKRSRRLQCYKDQQFCITKQALKDKKIHLAPLWSRYAKRVNSLSSQHNKLESKYFCSPNHDCRKDPLWSIGAAALYLHEISRFDLKELSLAAENQHESFLMAAGLYNQGPGLRDKLIAPAASTQGFRRGWEDKIPQVFKNLQTKKIIKIGNYYIYKNRKFRLIKKQKSFKNGTFSKRKIFNSRRRAIYIKDISQQPKRYIRKIRQCTSYKVVHYANLP